MLESLLDEIVKSGQFEAKIEDSLLQVTEIRSGSSYVIEEFSGSVQIRQAVAFDVDELGDEHVAQIMKLINELNRRFSGCKSFIDVWGNLINCSDILDQTALSKSVIVALTQIEFLSQALWFLYESLRKTGIVPGSDAVDAALTVQSE